MATKKLEPHPLADLFPMMPDADLAGLADDIEANGLRDAVWLYEGKILDGRNRYRACQMRDVDPRFEEYRGRDALGFVVSKNLHRRHLTESQRAMVAAKIANARQGERTDLQPKPDSAKVTTAKAAELLNVSPAIVKEARSVQAKGSPELIKAVESGAVSLNAAAEVAKLPTAEQEATVAAGPAAVKAKAAEVRREKKAAEATPEPEPAPSPAPKQTPPKRGEPKSVAWPIVHDVVNRLKEVYPADPNRKAAWQFLRNFLDGNP